MTATRAPKLRAAVVGASGYVGGELLRLLLDHPRLEPAQATSERFAGQVVTFKHPNLRGRTALKFVSLEDFLDGSGEVDVIFAALPHGQAQERIDELAAKAPRIVDLSADFRLRSSERYCRWYGAEHRRPEWLERFVYGLPELHREAIRGASYVSGVGCNATATNLALLPLLRHDLLDPARPVVCELKVGSSEGGHGASEAGHHPERSGSVRSFAPTGHRHTAEVKQALEPLGSPLSVHLSVTAIEMVRGILATAQGFVREGVTERDLFGAYREVCRDEPFLRLVKERRGIYRYPEPKILAGSNIAELGFELDRDPEAVPRRVVSLAALDNLMKGAAGTAIQAFNLMAGWDEALGLDFPGLHPI